MNRQKFQLNGLSVIYEDNHLIAINKPAGALVHGDETGDTTLSDLVKEYIKIRYGKPGEVFLGVIHRLDRPVSGVVIFARTSKALERMNKMLREHTMDKTYLAIVAVRPEEFSGTLVHHLIKDEQKNITRAYASKKTGTKESILKYHLEVHPITGRPHQIRTQLSKIGSPIIGDLKYGAEYPLHDKSIALHCYKMSFIHPVKNEKIVIKADPPSLAIWRTFTID